jgi:anaerobic ribonucleoside-triphosphate reductase activating protein
MQIRLAAPIQIDSVVDGEGIRAVIWTQGCPHNCLGCHNPGTHDFKGGYLEDIETLKKEIDSLEGQDGITFSGGDPLMQIDACLELAKHSKKRGLNVWCYTGFTFEQLLIMSKTNNALVELLNNIDVLVDGKFDLAKKSFEAPFRGSTNQRVLDCKESIKQQMPIEIEEYIYYENSVEKKEKDIYI